MTNQISTALLDILACPSCGSALAPTADAIACERCSRSYRLEHGVPVMYESAMTPAAASLQGPVARLLRGMAANPRVYDVIQKAVGYHKVAACIKSELADSRGTILDIGAGTGAVSDLIPEDAEYIWLDCDRRKLAGFRARDDDAPAVLADAQQLPLRDRSVDTVVTVDVSHHLDDEMLARFLAEAARVTSRLVFVDALRIDSAANRLLWRYDAGARPRPLNRLRDAIEREFVIERAQTFRVVHHYFLCSARPSDSTPITRARDTSERG